MPMYTYQCYECGHRFTHTCSAQSRQDEMPCTGCGGQAEQLVPEGVGHTFDLSATGDLPVPQNTGVSSFDYEVDRVAAAQARAQYAVVQERDAIKRSLQREYPDADIAMTVDGDYVPVARSVRSRTAKGRAFGEAVRQKARAFLGDSGSVRDHDEHLYDNMRRRGRR